MTHPIHLFSLQPLIRMNTAILKSAMSGIKEIEANITELMVEANQFALQAMLLVQLVDKKSVFLTQLNEYEHRLSLELAENEGSLTPRTLYLCSKIWQTIRKGVRQYSQRIFWQNIILPLLTKVYWYETVGCGCSSDCSSDTRSSCCVT